MAKFFMAKFGDFSLKMIIFKLINYMALGTGIFIE
jgi:hypothetical protein